MDNTMGSPLKPWPKLEPMSNARLRQPTLEETAKLPVPAHIPGQLSLFDADAHEVVEAWEAVVRCLWTGSDREALRQYAPRFHLGDLLWN